MTCCGGRFAVGDSVGWWQCWLALSASWYWCEGRRLHPPLSPRPPQGLPGVTHPPRPEKHLERPDPPGLPAALGGHLHSNDRKPS